ncbi:hypothetical protein BURKHO8Y_190028 [Burkholderia sp. 8Y]|nr:hypothetical protein BURKHO8Y_190028 [Burkholderia sp. 8Y]
MRESTEGRTSGHHPSAPCPGQIRAAAGAIARASVTRSNIRSQGAGQDGSRARELFNILRHFGAVRLPISDASAPANTRLTLVVTCIQP